MKHLLVFLSSFVILVSSFAAEQRPNVLFIAVDDLNHWIGHFGRNKQTKTPNLDRLAAMGVSFTNAQCAAPVCNPSRAALLSGKRPGTTGIYDNNNPFTQVLKPEVSLVMQFKKAGYDTLGTGKLWHGGLGWPEQWTTIQEEAKSKGKVDDRSIGGIAFGPIVEGGDEAVSDTGIADFGIAELGKTHEKPFFLTLGFHKPHMPWNVPQKYYDMHPLADIQLPPTKKDDLLDIPPSGVKMAKPTGDHAAVLASGRWKEAVQAYLAAISYLDGQIGRVLDAYDKSPAKDNTIIVFWGDHGWHLGEKEHWRKFALWEEATRAPFMWVVPGVTKPGGICKSPVDFMSVYPTLCDLTALPKLPIRIGEFRKNPKQVDRGSGRMEGARGWEMSVRLELQDILAPVRDDLVRVDARVRSAAEGEYPLLAAVVGDIVGAGGKRLRPAMMLLIAQALSHDPELVILAAAASELLHTAGLEAE